MLVVVAQTGRKLNLPDQLAKKLLSKSKRFIKSDDENAEGAITLNPKAKKTKVTKAKKTKKK